MSEHPYKPQSWRLTEYYPEAYARFMDILNDGIILDWNDDDHDRHEAEFLADLAAHDAELVDALVDAIRAEAWEEGYQAGLTEMCHDNPYRKARA